MIEVFYWFLWVSVVLDVSSQEQKFAIEPQDQTAIIGSRVTLPCRVINKSGNLQWTRNDFALGLHRNLSDYMRYQMVGTDDEGDFSLAIDQISLEDDARFQCQVGPGKSGEPGIRSRFARLTVLVPPERPEIVQGKEMVTTEDREIELECVSKGGKPAAEIIWIDGLGNVVTKNADYRIEVQPNDLMTARSTLKITPKKEHHNTTFVCQAQNSAERQYQSAKLQLLVKYAPKVRLEVKSVPSSNAGNARWNQIVEGEDVKIVCHVDANPTDVNYRWYLDDQFLFPEIPTEVLIRNISKRHHESIVKCEAYNSVGKSEDSETLQILYAPRFTRRPESIQVDSTAATVTLTCEVDGNPLPEISWIHEKLLEKKLVGRTSNMTVHVSNETVGKYICQAFSSPFPEITSEAFVHLKGKPTIVRQPVQFGLPGDDVRLTCFIHSVPLPVRVSWSFNGRDLRTDLGGEYSVSEDSTDDAVRSTLTVRNSKHEQFGVYNCTALNSYGADSVEIILRSQSGILHLWLSGSIPLVLPLIGVLGAVVIIITVILLTRLRHRKVKAKPPTPPTIVIDLEEQCKDSDRSSNVSDIKLEISTGSSTSNPNGDEDHTVYDSHYILKKLGPSHPSLDLGSQYSVNRFSLSNFSDPNFLSALDDHKKSGYIPNMMDLLKDFNPIPASPAHSQIHSETNSLKRCKNVSPHVNPFNQNINGSPVNAQNQNQNHCVSLPRCTQRNGGISTARCYPNQLSQSPTSQYIVAYNTDAAIIKKGSLATHV